MPVDKELLKKPELDRSLDSLQGTEETVNPPSAPVPQFDRRDTFESRGTGILVIIPTANKTKTGILKQAFNAKKPKDVEITYEQIPAESGVGEQPYDEAGIEGACNRINNALHALNEPKDDSERLDLSQMRIGTVMVASIENYIQRDEQGGGVDYGIVVMHNATTGNTTTAVSDGVPVPPAYLAHAQSLGFENGNRFHGKVTVGAVLKENVDGLDGANWHAVVAGRCRYDLLEEAIKRGPGIPW